MEKGKGVIQFTVAYCEDGTFDVDTLVKGLTFEALDALVKEGYVTAKFGIDLLTNSIKEKGEHIQ